MRSPKITMHHPDAGEATTTEAAFEALWKAKGWRTGPVVEPPAPRKQPPRRRPAKAEIVEPPESPNPPTEADTSADNQEES